MLFSYFSNSNSYHFIMIKEIVKGYNNVAKDYIMK